MLCEGRSCHSQAMGVVVVARKRKGTIYLLHFETPYKHARHYLGFVKGDDVQERMERHASGNGARLLAVLKENGICWRLVRTWKGDRAFERQLKKRGGAARICPVCCGKCAIDEFALYGTAS